MPEQIPSPSPTAARKLPIKLRYWFVGFALLAVVGGWLANERGYARLQAYKRQLMAKGEKLGVADHLPKLPPASSNAAPDFLAAAARLSKVKTPFYVYQRALSPGRARVTWRCEELPLGDDADRWLEFFHEVEANRQALAEMCAALERPELVFDWDYAKGVAMIFPGWEAARQVPDALANAVVADLRIGNADQAFAHLLTISRLARLRPAPFGYWLSHKAISCGPPAMLVTWEALQYPSWTEAQLSELQAVWQSWDVRAPWLATANLDRALTIEHFARCRTDWSLLFPDIMGPSNYYWDASRDLSENLEANWDVLKFRALANSTLAIWRLCFSHEDELVALQQRQLSLDVARSAVAADAFGPSYARLGVSHHPRNASHPSIIGSRQTGWWDERTLMSLANFETARRITCTAIALHRYRLKHGRFPESLPVLVAEFLAEVPRDFMDGQMLRYRPQPDGQFLLWSVGDDLKDDHGDANHPARSSIWNIPRCFDGRDWVWPQTASEAEVAAYHATLAARRAPPPPPPLTR